MKEKLLISACLLGVPCRYDGRSKPCSAVLALKERFELIPVCPEESGGLSTPRLPCEIVGGRVTRCDGKDLTPYYEKGAKLALSLARENCCKIAVLKEKSPSCGSKWIYDGSFTKTLTIGMGITAKLLSQNGIKVFNEEQTEEIEL
ncbi:MAG: DUF523 domain-containing protein [Ruminococcaceae bacterium]|nr:DUF523 domain-containing protein [Oscillospiraceae bacterium]